MKPNARSVWTVAVAVLFIAAIPGAVLAEHHEEMPAPGYSVVHLDEVGPANAAGYEENAKEWVATFKEAKMGKEWEWRTYAGPNFTYVFRTDAPNYAYMDGADARNAAMVEAIGKEKIDELSKDGRGSNKHWHELSKDLPEYNYMPEGFTGDYGFVRLATHSVKPGMDDQFKALVAKVTEARKKVGGGLAVFAYKVEFGKGSYQFAALAKDAAEFYSSGGVGPILVEAYGPEKAQAMLHDWRECITDFETSDWTFKPELSYMPGMYEAEEKNSDSEEMADGE